MSAIADAAQALAGLLRAAEEGGLPMPFTATTNDYAPRGHPAGGDERRDRGGISLQVDSLAELTEWSIWLDSPIFDDGQPYKGKLHRQVDGFAGPIPLRVTALVSAEVAS